MKITKESLRELWYEDEDGNRITELFDKNNDVIPRPKGFIYQHSRFPNQVRHNVLRLVVEEEVDACDHPMEHIWSTDGWVDGIEGRECRLCNGSQTKKEGESWPDKWEAHGSRQIMTSESGFNEELVLAIAKKSKYSLGEAIIIASQCCERCMNSLAYKYGLKWGYKEYSWEWIECNTSCEFCEHESKRRPTFFQKFLMWKIEKFRTGR